MISSPYFPPDGGCATRQVELPLSLAAGDEYEVAENFTASVPSGLPGIKIHVIANFKNGEAINECRDVQLVPNPPNPPIPPIPATNFTNITVNIRGDIEDYNSSIINYQIKIYPL